MVKVSLATFVLDVKPAGNPATLTFPPPAYAYTIGVIGSPSQTVTSLVPVVVTPMPIINLPVMVLVVAQVPVVVTI